MIMTTVAIIMQNSECIPSFDEVALEVASQLFS